MDQTTVNIVIVIILAYLVYQLNNRDNERLSRYLETKNPELNKSDMKKLYYKVRDGFIWGFIGILILTPADKITINLFPDNMAKWALMFVISTGFSVLNSEDSSLV